MDYSSPGIWVSESSSRFSSKDLGVDIRGPSRKLRIYYRTSHQIGAQAEWLLDPAMTDVDGHIKQRNDTISVFNGPRVTICRCETEEEETK